MSDTLPEPSFYKVRRFLISYENQYTILNDIGNNLSSKKLTSVTSVNNLSSSSNISGIINHEDNDTSSIRIEFSNKINYSDCIKVSFPNFKNLMQKIYL